MDEEELQELRGITLKKQQKWTLQILTKDSLEVL